MTERGAWLGERLRALPADFPFVGDVRGVGYMWGLEFVADPATAAPPDPALDVTAKAVAAAAASRLIVYPARFCVDGTRGDAVLIGPPLTATDEELEELLTRLHATLAALAPLFTGRSGRSRRHDRACRSVLAAELPAGRLAGSLREHRPILKVTLRLSLRYCIATALRYLRSAHVPGITVNGGCPRCRHSDDTRLAKRPGRKTSGTGSSRTAPIRAQVFLRRCLRFRSAGNHRIRRTRRLGFERPERRHALE